MIATGRRIAVLVAGLGLAAGPPPLRSQQPGAIVFVGQLVRTDGGSVGQVTVRTRQRVEALTHDDGSFELALPADVRVIEIQAVSLGGREWVVRYPTGAIHVPREPNVVTSIVLGPSDEDMIKEAFGTQTEKLLSALSASGVKQDEIVHALEALRRQFAERTQIEAESLRVAERRTLERAQHYPEISGALDGYVHEALDLRDAFRLASELAFASRPAFDELARAIREYNPAFERLNGGARGFVESVRVHWQSDLLAHELQQVLDYALGEIHRVHILPLNETLNVINRVRTGQLRGSAASKAREDVLARIAAAVRDLEPRLRELERLRDRVLKSLASG